MIWTLVITNKRSYCARSDAHVEWMRGEHVISIEVIK
jgi:hypothetical protein